MKPLVLASTSRYRRELLSRLNTPFQVFAPGVDEIALPGETPEATAMRLARLKAGAGAASFPDALIIGSDQVAVLDGDVMDKPGTRIRAADQLLRASGRTMVFHTALCVLDAASGRSQSTCVPVTVTFRSLTKDQVDRYLDAEQPFDCAGSARVEGLGIALLQRVESDDPTALIGLPLIRLVEMLAAEGVSIP